MVASRHGGGKKKGRKGRGGAKGWHREVRPPCQPLYLAQVGGEKRGEGREERDMLPGRAGLVPFSGERDRKKAEPRPSLNLARGGKGEKKKKTPPREGGGRGGKKEGASTLIIHPYFILSISRA